MKSNKLYDEEVLRYHLSRYLKHVKPNVIEYLLVDHEKTCASFVDRCLEMHILITYYDTLLNGADGHID